MMKSCVRCGELKPLSGFRFNQTTGYYRLNCRECDAAAAIISRDRRRAAFEALPPSDSKICSKCQGRKPLGRFGKDRSKPDGLQSYCKTCQYALSNDYAAVLRRYGLTKADYDAILAAQGGCCAICKSTEPGGKTKRRFCVDHDHETNAVRGLLCIHCNAALGHLRDDADLCLAAGAYLEHHRARPKLRIVR